MASHRLLPLAVAVMFNTACSLSPPAAPLTLEPPAPASTSALLEQGQHFGLDNNPLTPDDHILAMTPDMRYFVGEQVPAALSEQARLRYLVDALIRPSQLGLEYAPGVTLTATETFDERRGDCLSLSALFVAMAREAKLNVYFNEVSVPPSWEMLNDNSSAIYKHINAVAVIDDKPQVIDFSVDIYDYRYPQKQVDDDIAAAQYYSNLGVKQLNGGDPATAYAYFRRALHLGPEEAYIWGNLGVLLRREGLLDEAEIAFRKALSLDPEEAAALSNLARLYRSEGRRDEARALEAVIAERQRSNPFWHYSRSRAAFERGDFDEALTSIHRAIRLNREEYRFYQFAAVIYRRQGNDKKYEEYGLRAAQAKFASQQHTP